MDAREVIARAFCDNLRQYDDDPWPPWERLRNDQRQQALTFADAILGALAANQLAVVGREMPPIKGVLHMAKAALWMAVRHEVTREKFCEWVVVQQIDQALDAISPSPLSTGATP